MPQERANDLLQELSERLGKLLPKSNPSPEDLESASSLADDPDNPVILPGGGRRRSPEPAEVAREVIGNIDRDPDEEKLDTSPAALSLPILARIRARGIFEDDWRARPSESHPYPVICIHGTGTTKGDWTELGADLRAEGYAVFAPDFGHRATDSIAESASQIGAYIDAVMQVTGAAKVMLVSHSQGGTLARYWMRLMGGAPKVRHLVCLAAPNHGTTLGGIVSPLVRTSMAENIMNSLVSSWFGESGFEQVAGHATIEAINEGGDLEPGVSYTCIATRGDTVIQPPETCFLYPAEDEPSADERVRNIWIQDHHPRAVILHADLPQDDRVRKIVREELAQVS